MVTLNGTFVNVSPSFDTVLRETGEMGAPETLGDRLVQVMKRARLKNPAVAKAAGVHEKTVSKWRHDVQAPEEPELEAVVNLLAAHGVGVTKAWLRYGADLYDPAPGHGGFVRAAQPLTEPRYTAGPRSPLLRSSSARAQRVQAFVNDMVRLGADDFEADYVRERGRSYVESVLFADGAPELTEAEYDAELDEYLNKILRTWVINHMKARGAKPPK
jgi:hypothetical protein